jgi:tumor protein p53-inducible protein 3
MSKHKEMMAILVDSNKEMWWSQVPPPHCADHEVLVEIHSTAVNRADLLQRNGKYPPPPGASSILGLEMAGTICHVGKHVTDWQEGDRVLSLLSGGGYAEIVAVPASHLISIPKNWDYNYAAAIPEVFLTAYINLFKEANLKANETVVIHGGASGVGTAAIQLAVHTKCQVIATAGSEEKISFCKELGADCSVNYHKSDFAQIVKNHYGGADVILDINGAAYLARNIDSLKFKGRLVFIAILSGDKANLNIGKVLSKRLHLVGSTLRNRSEEEKTRIVENFKERFWSELLEGKIKPVIDTIYPIEKINEAHERLRTNSTIGKVVIEIRK